LLQPVVVATADPEIRNAAATIRTNGTQSTSLRRRLVVASKMRFI
jgi:hypothetical protein